VAGFYIGYLWLAHGFDTDVFSHAVNPNAGSALVLVLVPAFSHSFNNFIHHALPQTSGDFLVFARTHCNGFYSRQHAFVQAVQGLCIVKYVG